MNEMDKWTLHGAVLYEQVRASEQTQCGYHFCAGYMDAHFCNKVEGADIVLITAVCFQSSYSIITCNIKTRQCSYAMCRFDPE